MIQSPKREDVFSFFFINLCASCSDVNKRKPKFGRVSLQWEWSLDACLNWRAPGIAIAQDGLSPYLKLPRVV